jgi:hypothetical protein
MVEILVVISLLGLLAALTWPLIHSDTPQQQLQLGCDRLTSLMAMCRAQAMLLGHPVELTWPTPDASTSQILPVVMHEADPVGAAGEFQKMAAGWANDPVLPSNVQIRLIQLGDFDLSSLTKTEGHFDLPAEPSLQTVQFHPDGTADAAIFVLTTRLPEGSDQTELQGWVVVNAVSGLAQVKKPPTPAQFDAMLKAQAALPDLQLAEKAIEVSDTDSTGTAAMLGKSGLTQDGLNDFIAGLGGNGANAASALNGATGAKSATASAGTAGGAVGAKAAAGGKTNNPASGGNRNASAGGNSGSGAANRPSGGSGSGSNTSTGNNPSNRGGGGNTGTSGNRGAAGGNTGGSRNTGTGAGNTAGTAGAGRSG